MSFCAHHKEDFKCFVACSFMVNMRCCQHYLQLIPVHIKCSHKTARLWHALNFKGATLSLTHSLRKIMYKSISLHRCQEISSQTENQGKFFREHTCIASNYCHVKKSQREFPTQEILNRSRIQRSDLKRCCWGLEPSCHCSSHSDKRVSDGLPTQKTSTKLIIISITAI